MRTQPEAIASVDAGEYSRLYSNVMKAERDSGTLILPESFARRKSSRVSCIVWQKVCNSGDA